MTVFVLALIQEQKNLKMPVVGPIMLIAQPPLKYQQQQQQLLLQHQLQQQSQINQAHRVLAELLNVIGFMFATKKMLVTGSLKHLHHQAADMDLDQVSHQIQVKYSKDYVSVLNSIDSFFLAKQRRIRFCSLVFGMCSLAYEGPRVSS